MTDHTIRYRIALSRTVLPRSCVNHQSEWRGKFLIGGQSHLKICPTRTKNNFKDSFLSLFSRRIFSLYLSRSFLRSLLLLQLILICRIRSLRYYPFSFFVCSFTLVSLIQLYSTTSFVEKPLLCVLPFVICGMWVLW